MMSLVILGVGMVALGGVFLATAQLSGIAASRTRAVGLATRDLEAFRGMPYCDVGYTTGAGNQVTLPTWTDNSITYAVANPGGNPNLLEPQPSGSAVIAGRTYTIGRMVVWVDSPGANGGVGTAFTHAYKRVVETVSWTDHTTHSVRQDGVLYPGALGAYSDKNCGGFTSVDNGFPPKAVTGLTATHDATTPDNTIDLAWTVPAGGCNCDSYRVVYSFDNFATSYTLGVTGSGSATSYRVTTLAPATTYTFAIYSVELVNGQEVQSTTTSLMTQAPAAQVGCTVASSATNFSLVSSSNTGADQGSGVATLAVPGTSTATNVNVSVVSAGPCTYLQLAYNPVNGDGGPTIIPLVLGAANHWTATMDGTGTNWTVGPHIVSVEDGTSTVLAAANFSVCANTKTVCP